MTSTSRSPPLPRLLPEVPSRWRSGTSTQLLTSEVTSAPTETSVLSVDIRHRVPTSHEDDPLISMPILHRNDSYKEDDSSLTLISKSTGEPYMDKRIKRKRIRPFRRTKPILIIPESDDSFQTSKQSDSSCEDCPSSNFNILTDPLTSYNFLDDFYPEWPHKIGHIPDVNDDFLKESFEISEEDAIRCALKIPEEYVPTPHEDFMKELNLQNTCNRSNSKMLASGAVGKRKSSIQNGDDEAKTETVSIGHPLAKETDRKLRSAFAKYKKWDEAERSKLEKLGDNKIKVNGNFIIEVDYTNYITEQDVQLDMDEDWRSCTMPPLPLLPTALNCQASPCRLGCICDSITHDSIPRTHCGKPKCFFDCSCQQTVFSNGDDTDIRSRLRPRVSLLNWRYMEPAEREKDPPTNYRQLERGATVYPRMRRVAVAPQRFRNEFVMAHKYKDTFGRDRRAPAASLKFIRKPTGTGAIKRDGHSSLYRRPYGNGGKGSSTVKSKESLPSKMNECKPCTVTIDPIITRKARSTAVLNDKKSVSQIAKVQSELNVPHLVQVMTEDGQVVLIGLESMCFFAWTLHSKHPKAVIYKSVKGDMMPIPWLYVPVPSYGEVWVFHQVSDSLSRSSYTYIPEINCMLVSKALQMHFNVAHTKKKAVVLQILWIGEDTRKRMGSIYIFPELPGVLVCGPFPKNQIKSKNAFGCDKVTNAINVNAFVEKITAERYMRPANSWDSLFANLSAQDLNNLLNQENENSEDGDMIPENEFVEMVPSFRQSNEASSYTNLGPIRKVHKPMEKLKVSWMDAAKVLKKNLPVL